MPDRVVTLPPDLDDFVLSSIESGRFESTTELVRAALIAFHREQTSHEASRLGAAIAEGDAFRRLWEASAQTSFSLSR
ncbi:MAG: type II toxin-antitoxin system ParD family antitoxin [Terracidiphilus sp.]|jgi:putative addiction module CopG family antidote